MGSSDLSDWQALAGVIEDRVDSLGGDIEQVVFDLGTLGAPRGFVRVRVER
jgi:hypothetical protein